MLAKTDWSISPTGDATPAWPPAPAASDAPGVAAEELLEERAASPPAEVRAAVPATSRADPVCEDNVEGGDDDGDDDGSSSAGRQQ